MRRPRSPKRCSPGARRSPASRKQHGAVEDTAQLVGRDGKVIAAGGAPDLAFSVAPARQPTFQPAHARRRQLAGRPRSGGDRREHGQTPQLQDRPDDRRDRPRRRAAPAHLRHRQDRRRLLARRRDDRDLRIRVAQKALPQARRARLDLDRGQPRLHADPAGRTRSSRCCRPTPRFAPAKHRPSRQTKTPTASSRSSTTSCSPSAASPCSWARS